MNRNETSKKRKIPAYNQVLIFNVIWVHIILVKNLSQDDSAEWPHRGHVQPQPGDGAAEPPPQGWEHVARGGLL